MPSTPPVLQDLASGEFRLTRHALERMAERSVTKADIRNLGNHGVVEPPTEASSRSAALILTTWS